MASALCRHSINDINFRNVAYLLNLRRKKINRFVLAGDWLLILVHAIKQYRGNLVNNVNIDNIDGLLESLRLKNFGYFWLSATTIGYSIYYAIGGFLHVSIA